MADSTKTPEEDTGTWKKSESKFSRYANPQPQHLDQRAHTIIQQTHQRILRPMSRSSEQKLEMLTAERWRQIAVRGLL
jgi:phage terminase small subunit